MTNHRRSSVVRSLGHGVQIAEKGSDLSVREVRQIVTSQHTLGQNVHDGVRDDPERGQASQSYAEPTQQALHKLPCFELPPNVAFRSRIMKIATCNVNGTAGAVSVARSDDVALEFLEERQDLGSRKMSHDFLVLGAGTAGAVAPGRTETFANG
jgi:hypothetical protein